MHKGCWLSVCLLSLLGFSSASLSEDCLVSTGTPDIVAGFPGVVDDHLNEAEGRYSASFEDGGLIMVSFAPCELALRAHYLKKGAVLEEGELEQLLKYLIPSQSSQDKVVGAVKAGKPLKVGDTQVYEGVNDQHQVSVQASKSPAYSLEIHYEWLPPQH